MLLKMIYYSLLRKSNINLSTRAQFSTSPTFKEQKIKIMNYEINYLTVGRGPHHVFCSPGAMGTIWSDFGKQIKGFDQEKFQLVVWDPPGFGKSIILDDKVAVDIFSKGADMAYEFMKALQIPSYSLLGWSNGGLICLLLAGRNPDVANKVVAWGTSTFLFPDEIERYKNMKDLNNWSKPMKEEMIKLYGEDIFKKKIDNLVESMILLYYSNTTYCDHVKCVKCPTLLLHGAKDPVADSRHLRYLHSIIENSRTYLYSEGKHNIHMKYADDFNKRVQDFLLSSI